MNGIILYGSKYGTTKRYAEWIAEETGFDIAEVKKAKIADVKQYDAVILGGGIYASGIMGLSFLKKHISELQGKKIVVFCDGASPYEENAFRKIVEFNMKDELAGIPCFYCRGAWDPDGMGMIDRNLCRMLQNAVKKKDPNECEIWEKALKEAGSEKHDWTDRSYIAPIIEAVKQANDG